MEFLPRGFVHGQHGDEVFVEHLGQRGFKNRSRARRQFGKLEHRAVTRRKRCTQGPDGKVDRIIPRRDNADHAFGLLVHFRTRRLQVQFDVPSLRLHPSPQMLHGVANERQRRKNVEQHRFAPRSAAEVCVNCRGDCFPISADDLRQRAQSIDPGLVTRRRVARKRGALLLEDLTYRRTHTSRSCTRRFQKKL
jgi:hypothetical protein